MTPCGLYQLQSQLVSSTTPCGPIWPHMTPCQPQLSSNKSLRFQNSTQYDPLWTLSAPESTCIFNHPLWPHLTPCQPKLSSNKSLPFQNSTQYDLLWTLSAPDSTCIFNHPLRPHQTPYDPIRIMTFIKIVFNISKLQDLKDIKFRSYNTNSFCEEFKKLKGTRFKPETLQVWFC